MNFRNSMRAIRMKISNIFFSLTAIVITRNQFINILFGMICEIYYSYLCNYEFVCNIYMILYCIYMEESFRFSFLMWNSTDFCKFTTFSSQNFFLNLNHEEWFSKSNNVVRFLHYLIRTLPVWLLIAFRYSLYYYPLNLRLN